MSRIAVAASNAMSAAAGIALADAGGNAVDAAVAAAITSCCTEPGVCSLGGGGFLLAGHRGRQVMAIDANVEMPGRGQPRDQFERGIWEYRSGYAGGMHTAIGHGTIATPGLLKGFHHLHAEFGQAPWSDVLEPAIVAARDGFPLGRSNHHYLDFVHDGLYGWHEPSRRVLHDHDGNLLGVGANVRIPELADTLEALASEGVDLLYRGELGAMIADDIAANDGLLTREDLAAYDLRVGAARRVSWHDWDIATVPPPSIGGAVLSALLLLLGDEPDGAWTPRAIRRVIDTQVAVLGRRATHLDVADDLHAAASVFVEEALAAGLVPHGASPSTVQVSVCDDDGLAVSITASSGYGSGVMTPGTGIWMNNSLGEFELNRRGIHALPVGTRLPSNMAPTIARANGRVLAIGSPGADRITTAIQQVLAGVIGARLPLDDANRHPRVHVARTEDGEVQVWHEEDLEVGDLPWPTRAFPPTSMMFGGVAVVEAGGHCGLDAQADPRRDGAALVGGARS
jgi:gamma-glutamyltranspeptidase / glutathione hydrolase